MDNVVSVIIPVFNRFEYADRAILSVLKQTYTHWELFVVDDCSKEAFALPKECENFQQRIVLLRNEKNVGPGLSRQRGLDLSIGKFVCFLDSDDYYEELFLERMIEYIKENDTISGVYCTSFDLATSEIRKSSNHSYNNILPTLFDYNRPWATCSWMWRRKYIGKWTELRTNQDSLFEIEVSFKNNNIAHLDEILCFIDKGTATNTIDLVGNLKNELNRNEVAIFSLMHLDKIQGDSEIMLKSVLSRLLYTSARLLKHGEFSKVWSNLYLFIIHVEGQLTLKFALGSTLLISLINKEIGFRILEKYRLKYATI
jgi:glycosyltransferase involved in cell wall biosynthesis